MSTPILFLHGWTMRGTIFDDLMARMGAEFDCNAPDLPGHGDALGREPTLDACADMVAEILGTNRQPAVLVGWSMGAAAAWRYIDRYGTGQLAGLVTVDMSPKIVPTNDWPHGLIRQSADSVAATTQRFSSDWEEATHGIAATMFAHSDGAPGYPRDRAREIILSQDASAMRAMWADLLAMDARDVMAKVDIPWLVCSGALSRVYPASASDWIAEQAPQAVRHVFSASGHSPHLEEPQAFADVIDDFARQVTASGADILGLHQ